MAELCDVYDKDGNRTEQVFYRGTALEEGQYRMIVNIWIADKAGRLLIQKRSPQKAYMPNMWATHGGGVQAGETSREAAVREVREEIGMCLKADELCYLTRLTGDHYFMDNYAVVRDGFDPSDALLQEEEVSGLKWATPNEVLALAKAGRFFEYPEFPKVWRFLNNLNSMM